MQKHMTITLLLTLFVACDRAETPVGSTTRVTEAKNQPLFWEELDLSLDEMNEFCAGEAKKSPKTKGTGRLAPSDPPTELVETAHWKGMLRYLHHGEGCFVNVGAVSVDNVHELATFEDELGLPSCEHRFEYPSAIVCLVAEGDPSGLVMWQARFSADQKLSDLGLSTKGYSPARGEKTFGANVVRPKDRPDRSEATDLFTPWIARVEIDEHGITYDRSAPWFTDLETPVVRDRFGGKVQTCSETASRCSFSSNEERSAELQRLLKRQRNYIGQKLPPTLDERQRADTVAIDAAGSTPWGQMRWAVHTATTAAPRVIFVADGPKAGLLPTFSHIAPVGWEDRATPEVEDVPEPAGSPMVKPPTVKISTAEVSIIVDEQTKSFPRGGEGFDWSAVHDGFVELYPKQKTRPRLELLADAEVPWEQVFRVVEAAAYHGDGQRLFDVVF